MSTQFFALCERCPDGDNSRDFLLGKSLHFTTLEYNPNPDCKDQRIPCISLVRASCKDSSKLYYFALIVTNILERKSSADCERFIVSDL